MGIQWTVGPRMHSPEATHESALAHVRVRRSVSVFLDQLGTAGIAAIPWLGLQGAFSAKLFDSCSLSPRSGDQSSSSSICADRKIADHPEAFVFPQVLKIFPFQLESGNLAATVATVETSILGQRGSRWKQCTSPDSENWRQDDCTGRVQLPGPFSGRRLELTGEVETTTSPAGLGLADRRSRIEDQASNFLGSRSGPRAENFGHRCSGRNGW